MDQIYFTADLHFGHPNILKHSPKRPYSDTVDIVAHDAWLLDLWCNTVDKRDTIYILGDLTKQMTGMMAAPILIGTDSFICVVVVIYNLQERRLYLHETFLTEKIPEIAASSLVRGSNAASPQSLGSIAKILQSWIKSK